MAAPEDFARVGDLLGGACEAAAVPESRGADEAPAVRASDPGDMSRAVAMAWPELVGDEVAANASPVRLKAGRLTVATSSSVWAHTLQYMEADLVSRLSQRLGPEAVQQIVFRHAGWEERPRTGPAAGLSERSASQTGGRTSGSPGRLSAEQKAALADVEELDLPPAIREKVTRAMKAAFVRAQRDSVR